MALAGPGSALLSYFIVGLFVYTVVIILCALLGFDKCSLLCANGHSVERCRRCTRYLVHSLSLVLASYHLLSALLWVTYLLTSCLIVLSQVGIIGCSCTSKRLESGHLIKVWTVLQEFIYTSALPLLLSIPTNSFPK